MDKENVTCAQAAGINVYVCYRHHPHHEWHVSHI